MTYGVGGNDAADGPDAVRGVDYFFVRVQYEICGVDNLSPLFPKSTHLIRVPGHFQPISHGKCELQLFDGLSGLI